MWLARVHAGSLLVLLLHAAGALDCPDNRCCRHDVAEYVRLCSAVKLHCFQQQSAGSCACDADGIVEAVDASGEEVPLTASLDVGNATTKCGQPGRDGCWVHTGRPGCAKHLETWERHSGEFCYVRYDCQEGQHTFYHPNIKWRPCSVVHPQCPAGCQAALDAILSPGTIKDCITDAASRQVRNATRTQMQLW